LRQIALIIVGGKCHPIYPGRGSKDYFEVKDGWFVQKGSLPIGAPSDEDEILVLFSKVDADLDEFSRMEYPSPLRDEILNMIRKRAPGSHFGKIIRLTR
jgi:hypothetical protein